MTMTGFKKFSFEREFDRGSTSPIVQKQPEPTLAMSEHEAALREAEAKAFLRGHVEGAAAARLEEEARLARALEGMTAVLRQSAERLGHIETQASGEALRFAIEFAGMLSGSLVAERPIGPIAAAARQVFGDLRGVPHVAVRVAPDLVEPAREALSRIAREIGLDAKMIVLGEPEIATGDCRIEWADGGIVRDQALLKSKLDDAVTRALAQPPHFAEQGIEP
ncbi:MAG: hypothetical protein K2P80_01080 [Beijerinckiaceae bacterium]|nr:hypothetical protein [Beijerinckiaceae bacterium]